MQILKTATFSPRSWGLRGGAALACALAGLVIGAHAALPPDPNASLVQAQLIADRDAAVPGGTLTLGVRLQHTAHWHTYWRMPGDAGLPTRVAWKLDPGYVAGPVQWPVPARLRVGDLANYGYEGTVVLPIAIRVPASARPGERAQLAAHVDWLVCNDLCIPGGADLKLSLPVRSAGEAHGSAEAAEVAAALQRVPPAMTLAGARAQRVGDRVVLEYTAPKPAPRRLEFFAYEAERIQAAADQRLSVHGQQVRLELDAATPVDPSFQALRGVLVADGGPGATGGWAGSIDVPLRAGAAVSPAAAGPGSHAPLAPTATGAVVQPVVAAELAPPTALAPADAAAATGAAADSLNAVSAALALVGALFGGIILNLMPCVFPVLSLKLMGLVQHRDEAPARLRLHGLAYAGGVMLSFLALAALLLALRAAGSQVGWGFQLQSPLVIAALTVLFFLVGLNLLGAFEFTLGSSLVNRAAQALPAAGGQGAHEALAASLATGVLAAVVASPCTAPFMGAALGYAAVQSAPLALLVFAALGAGMALPYLVLTLVPSWLQRLPRPGPWMERLKQVMAFPMFLTCVWLLWVLGQQVEIDAVAGLLAALVCLALWAWAAGLAQRGARRMRWVAGGALLVTAAFVLATWRAAPAPAVTVQAQAAEAPGAGAAVDPVAAWGPWDEGAQARAIAQGRPVFVDFTAAWCITCQANKRLVLHDAQVEAAFAQRGVLRLQADWTRRDEAISRELARLQRNGVPVYVLYDRKGMQHILPEILSTRAVLDALGAV